MLNETDAYTIVFSSSPSLFSLSNTLPTFSSRTSIVGRYNYDQKAALNHDYVLVSKVPGPNDNVFLFIVSFMFLGRIETIKLFTAEIVANC